MSPRPDRPPSFWSRNRDELILQAIGGLVLATLVALAISWIDYTRDVERAARDEALSNSLFVRQAVMSERELLPFSALYLDSAQLSGLALAGADFSDAVLTGAELKGSDLTGAALEEADLTGADLSYATLVDADLSEATMRDVDLTGADLSGADLSATDLGGAYFADDEPPTGLDVAGLGVVALDADEADEDDD